MSMIWKPIVGFEDCGEVSNTGLIRNKHGLIRKTNIGKNGYERVGFHGGQETVFVHRLVARAFCDGYADGLEINHKDGDKLNNTASNLEWVTPSENIKHAYRTGLKVHSRANMIIQDEDLSQLLSRAKSGETYQSIADSYGVGCGTMWKRLKEYNGGLVR
jgi:hypothetical protein